MIFRLGSLFLFGLCVFAQGDLSVSQAIPSTLTAEYRGVSLNDLADPKNGVKQSLAELSAAALEYVVRQPDLRFKKVHSISFQKFDLGILTVDIFGRDPRFSVTRKDGLGGTGFLRVEILFDTREGLPHIIGHKLGIQRDLVELNPQARVSLGDRLVAVEDAETGFRRTFPLGVGSIDSVRFRGITTIMTPTTEWSVLDKHNLHRARHLPKYFRGKPFINFRIPLAPPVEGKPTRYRSSAIAFHIWQAPRFERGFLSHGCMRMRDDDLMEMLALVDGVKEFIPVKVRVERVAGAQHPFPYLAEQHNAVRNFGTKQKPVARKVADEFGVQLTKTVKVQSAPPSIGELKGVSMDPAVFGPDARGALEEEDYRLED